MISQIENREEAGRLQHLAHRLEVGALFALLLLVQPAQGNVGNRPMLAAPIWVYNNWSAYGELSDEVPLNEELAMRELGEMLRLRKAGVHFGYYMMDAFWYDPDGGYRVWRRQDWPDGPDQWISACLSEGIKPGLWFSSNTLTRMNAAPQWLTSLNASGTRMALYSGGFLADFMGVLQLANWFGWPAKVISIIGGIIFLAFVFVWRMALPLIFVGLVVLIAALITATHYGLLVIYRWRRKSSMRRVSGGVHSRVN